MPCSTPGQQGVDWSVGQKLLIVLSTEPIFFLDCL
jgi:hypothetical protein